MRGRTSSRLAPSCEMLTGHGRTERTAAGIVAAIMREPAPSPRHEIPDVPALVDAAIRKCLEKDPGRRWQSMEAVRDVLKWADEMKIPATADQPVSGRWRTVATVALGLALVSGTWMVSRVLHRACHARAAGAQRYRRAANDESRI